MPQLPVHGTWVAPQLWCKILVRVQYSQRRRKIHENQGQMVPLLQDAPALVLRRPHYYLKIKPSKAIFNSVSKVKHGFALLRHVIGLKTQHHPSHRLELKKNPVATWRFVALQETCLFSFSSHIEALQYFHQFYLSNAFITLVLVHHSVSNKFWSRKRQHIYLLSLAYVTTV